MGDISLELQKNEPSQENLEAYDRLTKGYPSIFGLFTNIKEGIDRRIVYTGPKGLILTLSGEDIEQVRREVIGEWAREFRCNAYSIEWGKELPGTGITLTPFRVYLID